MKQAGIYVNDINLSGLSKEEGESKLKAIENSLRPDINLQIKEIKKNRRMWMKN